MLVGKDHVMGVGPQAFRGDGAGAAFAGIAGGRVLAGRGRGTGLQEARQAALVVEHVGPVAEVARVGAAGDAADAVDGGAVPPVAVVEMERAVGRRPEVHLGHHPAVVGAHVADMIRALPQHAPVVPVRAQAFGVPVVHPAALAAGGLRRVRGKKKCEGGGEDRDRGSGRSFGVGLGHAVLLFDPEAAPRRDAVPSHVGSPAGPAREFFLWGR